MTNTYKLKPGSADAPPFYLTLLIAHLKTRRENQFGVLIVMNSLDSKHSKAATHARNTRDWQNVLMIEVFCLGERIQFKKLKKIPQKLGRQEESKLLSQLSLSRLVTAEKPLNIESMWEVEM